MDTPKIHPTEISSPGSNLEGLLVECCKLQSLEGMQLVQEILERVLVEKGRYRDEEVDVFIPVTLFDKVLFGWVKLADKHTIALERMRDLMDTVVDEARDDITHLDRIEMSPGEDDTIPSQPTVYVFNTFLDGLAQAAKLSRGAAFLAESTIFHMKDLHAQKGWHTKPNTRSYTHVIRAFGNAWHPNAGEKAIAILEHVHQEHQSELVAYQAKHGVKYDEKDVSTTTPKIVTVDHTR